MPCGENAGMPRGSFTSHSNPVSRANPHPERRRRTLLWFDVPAPGESASDLTSLEEREERLANNAIVFRTVNEEIEQVALRLGGDNYEFICECSTRGCFERVVLSRREYEHVRSEGVRFFVAPGHENPEVELVVETNPNVPHRREGWTCGDGRRGRGPT